MTSRNMIFALKDNSKSSEIPTLPLEGEKEVERPNEQSTNKEKDNAPGNLYISPDPPLPALKSAKSIPTPREVIPRMTKMNPINYRQIDNPTS